MSILVTGGLGFIGRHLVARLLEAGREVTVVDDLSNSDATPLEIAELSRVADVAITDIVRYRAGGRRFTQIFHLASPVGSLGILKHSGLIAKQIIDGTDAALRLAYDSSARLMFVSSSEVYADAQSHAEGEQLCLGRPSGARVEYAVGKYAAEVMIRNTALVRPLDCNICRPFNLFGEFQSTKAGFVVPRFVKAALRHEPLTVFSDGQQRRAFCHVSDFVEGLIKLQQSSLTGVTLNLGHPGNVTTIEDLARRVIRLCSSQSQITYVDPVELYGRVYSEGHEKMPNTDLARSLIDWSPRVDLDAGIMRLRNWTQGRESNAGTDQLHRNDVQQLPPNVEST